MLKIRRGSFMVGKKCEILDPFFNTFQCVLIALKQRFADLLNLMFYLFYFICFTRVYKRNNLNIVQVFTFLRNIKLYCLLNIFNTRKAFSFYCVDT